MPTWLDKLRGAGDGPDIAHYKSLRAAGKSWSPKVLRHPASKRFDLLKAARKLGLDVNDRTIVFDDETEMDILTDFFLFDYRLDGKSAIESCAFAPGDLTPMEEEYHRAALASHTSLFDALNVHGREPKILLRDRLAPDAPEIWLTDFGLSESFLRLGRVFLFIRVLSARGLHMTSGFGFIFAPKFESSLVDGCHRSLWSASSAGQRNTKRMIHFFGLNRKIGQPLVFKDAPAAKAGENEI